jgi:C4-dicarboxylate transporter DctM subunit
MTLVAILIALLALILIGQPLFVLIGSATLWGYVFISEEPLSVLIGDLFFAADKEVLLAVPLFVLAGQVMTKGSISTRLINLAQTATTAMPGGMAIAGVFALGVFAAISGSSPVTLIAIGSVMYPALIKAGYPKNLSMGLMTVGGTLGIIVPPSIPMIIFAIMASVSVIDLFKAGVGPSILLMLLLLIYSVFKAPKSVRSPFNLNNFVSSFKSGIAALMMPIVILGGIYSGYFTATESAAIAVLYALLVELLWHRELKLKDLSVVLKETSELLGMLFLILIIAVSLNKFMTYEDIPQTMVEMMKGIISSKWSFLIAVNILLLIAGCLMDVMSAILVLAPLLTPMAIFYGVDPVHFGVMMIVNLEIGYVTPPIGINLFVASGIFKENLGEVIRSVLPFIVVMMIGLILITFIPQISLWYR